MDQRIVSAERHVKTHASACANALEGAVVNDQAGCPTAAEGVAKAILVIAGHLRAARLRRLGDLPYGGAPPLIWYDFARSIVEDGGPTVVAMTTQNWPSCPKAAQLGAGIAAASTAFCGDSPARLGR
jgi:dTDP-4-dehydrorhamnose reductase